MSAEVPAPGQDVLPDGRIVLLETFVPGKPEPEGSTHAVATRTGARRAYVRQGGSEERGERLHAWREMVKAALRDEWLEQDDQTPLPPLAGPVAVRCDFYMPRLKSTPKSAEWHASTPDLDKLTRAVWDCLTGIVIVDDRQICDQPGGSKRWAPLDGLPGPGVGIVVTNVARGVPRVPRREV